ncbi:hypothetical protein BdWA1_000852 [Babesia duncani]|uniref:Uncharacterized protein n=1 Tax=Babesia duncani TaxID=323732 RepID=A0AAD9PMX8_9APIC|nr:hypothetical protein BdWA1_000852 [Babesia duncani]
MKGCMPRILENVNMLSVDNVTSVLHAATRLRYPQQHELLGLALHAIKSREIGDRSLVNLTLATAKIVANTTISDNKDPNQGSEQPELLNADHKRLITRLLDLVPLRAIQFSAMDQLRCLVAYRQLHPYCKAAGLALSNSLEAFSRSFYVNRLFVSHATIALQALVDMDITSGRLVEALVAHVERKRGLGATTPQVC